MGKLLAIPVWVTCPVEVVLEHLAQEVRESLDS